MCTQIWSRKIINPEPWDVCKFTFITCPHFVQADKDGKPPVMDQRQVMNHVLTAFTLNCKVTVFVAACVMLLG